jgi:hypothetical protein
LGLSQAFFHLPALGHIPQSACQPDGIALLVTI